MNFIYTPPPTSIRVEDIYGVANPDTPLTQAVVAFRLPLKGEFFLSLAGSPMRSETDFLQNDGPRLILTPVKVKRRWMIEVEESNPWACGDRLVDPSRVVGKEYNLPASNSPASIWGRVTDIKEITGK